ncbi:unnamed protein product [Symbiodinium sp. CCMP2456]|nr:unnamed protein product [Symbiodinium sp. CCMP2456]
MLGPVLDGDGSKKCPVCDGAKGPGKCFQFACPESSPLSYSCGNLPAKDPVYCGSHPYFAGYLPGDQCAGSFGPPLFSMTRRMLDSNIDFVAASIYRAGCETQIDLFPVSQEVWQNEKRSVRVALTEHRQSVISATILPPHEVLSSQVSLAVAIPTDDFEDAGSIYLQRRHESDCVVKRDADLPEAWAGWSEITSEGNPHFLQQVIVLSHLQCCVGLSHDSLWTMDLSEVESGGMSASDMAGKLKWLKVMGLPAERYMRDEIPHRLLARGHGNDEVIIFALEGAKFKPQMLVELSGKPIGQSVRATKLTSTVHVCLTSADFADASLPSRLLPTVTRVGGRQSGYLFFDQLGQAHLLRDEAIIADHEAWAEPDMKDEESMQRAVSFTLQRLSGDSEKRFCLMGMLMHFEYFSKLFKGWREGASAEVCMNDIDPDAFDHFLKYAQSGKLDSNLELQMLMKLIRFGNKCILPDFLSRCLVLVLRILDEPRQMREKSPTTLAELLLLADDAAISCPTLKMKVIDSILCFRSDVLKDPQFLSKVVAQDSSLLATMLSLVVSEPE